MAYEAFLDDPEHITRLDGQRFVVLRPSEVVSEYYRQVQNELRRRLAGLPVSYPARAHVTLAGFAAGTTLESVRELISGWVRHVPLLRIQVERATSFPPPSQIAILQVLRTPALFRSLTALRRSAVEQGLTLSTVTPVEEWVFHMSLAYCSKLNAAEWDALARVIEARHTSGVSCVQETVEIVAFDDGDEYSGGEYLLSRDSL